MSNKKDVIEIFPDNDPKTNPRWYALYTKPRAEKKVKGRLKSKGFNVFLPLKEVERKWSDRTKLVEIPLIRSYVFVNIPLIDSLPVLQTSGVVGFVRFKGEYAPIPDYQIETLRRTLETKANLEPVDYFQKGQLVKVTQGPLEGAIGRIKMIKNRSKLIISLDALQSSYSVNVNPEHVQAIKKKNPNQ
ncbi:MAG: UpxY family transcription antiterminator [Candidatus Marinimicrobia bacterium]|nr:UpxY family transcription antiterminator [Candidatus Neomarinimicrobiota bacterium]